jgi:hypothetical protein
VVVVVGLGVVVGVGVVGTVVVVVVTVPHGEIDCDFGSFCELLPYTWTR